MQGSQCATAPLPQCATGQVASAGEKGSLGTENRKVVTPLLRMRHGLPYVYAVEK